MSGYLGSIGFGYPAAIGAWAATHGERPIVALTATADSASTWPRSSPPSKHGMNITHVLLNNGQLGKISKEQRAGEWDVWETSLHNPDFSKYAELCGRWESGSPTGPSWTMRSAGRSPTTARRWSRSSPTPDLV